MKTWHRKGVKVYEGQLVVACTVVNRGEYDDPTDEDIENAKLIAAAPELLAALKAYVSGGPHAATMAERAIAKATL